MFDCSHYLIQKWNSFVIKLVREVSFVKVFPRVYSLIVDVLPAVMSYRIACTSDIYCIKETKLD
jgi:hypothetical protein